MKPNRIHFTPARWRRFARGCAADAFTNCFSSRRGVWHYEDLDVLVVYSNNPYQHRPLLRDREFELLIRKLAAVDVSEHARASFPTGGPDDGYTVAVVLNARGDLQSLVAKLYEASLDEAAAEDTHGRHGTPGGRESR